MQILHLDSSIQGAASASRTLTKAVVANLLDQHPGAAVTYHDLVEEAVPHLDGPIGAGFRPLAFNASDETTRREHARSDVLVGELMASDVIVVGAPMYNFSVASQLKAWLDRVIQPGKTFRYTENGPIGLAGGKKVVIVSTRGGSYLSGPLTSMDFQESYLRTAFGFMGIKDLDFIRAENMSRGDDARANSMNSALQAVSPLVASMAA
ncbi:MULTISPECIES: FMN-dependent NADH-azoreductase [unclassified Mesorhizobium]|uniref:FMN-dependent NADH-azoreductase n=1 Tax=unclassified Mesorhizobium TaxID=325217 RepID=UPI000FDB66C5|nr:MULTISPECIES: FMN-dependent NADH-azoreductase [unclassified Mesorhizobium]TGR43680.1 FMN-dependent NADH-azoreductase [bacterium M00.F.Ca.ET.199.01.1.1]TGU40292.1 FMN-dependent NADH-azoreductase [bacterium M00.F.Ca.ET.156.01.1.1]TGV86833.1 FMN-dependent NADH-azoreductase [Mesorhizobium sp. M00.F.Ca.ET.149.01.1.1]TGR28013.1 FMN-dependent NADH-azoreductase [Mesorhizobium sp. M8A.F.Ca.ET.197.01.1.1]TGR32415.1 FMN-dependent NADH-azoreductase [Mesorhizobium sp. M8A.F.Ca.ET.202.01.1.1]